MHEFAEAEKGPDPRDPSVRRKNVRTLLVAAALVAVAAILPGTCRRFVQPDARYETRTEAVEAGAVDSGVLPRFLPDGAADIRVRHDRSGRRFIRFGYDTAQAAALTAGMRPVPQEEKESIAVTGAGYVSWFPLNERTLSGSQGEYLDVYEVIAGPDRGWLALDARTGHAYYWSTGGP